MFIPFKECFSFGEGLRVLFMPHSPGIYAALVLKEYGETTEAVMSQSQMRKHSSGVSKKTIKNNLFLNLASLSKNLQTILK